MSWFIGYMDGDGSYYITRNNKYIVPKLQLLCNRIKSPGMLEYIRNHIFAKYIDPSFFDIPIYTQTRTKYNKGAGAIDKFYIQNKPDVVAIQIWLAKAYTSPLIWQDVFAGFCDADACFAITSPGAGGTPKLTIGLHYKQQAYLKSWQQTIEVAGGLTKQKQTMNLADGTPNYQVSWQITAREDIFKVRDILDGRLIPCNKAEQFKIWSEAVRVWEGHKKYAKWHPEKRKQMKDLKQKLSNLKKNR